MSEEITSTESTEVDTGDYNEEAIDTGFDTDDSIGSGEDTSQEEAKRQAKRYRVKINDEEVEVDEEELIRGYQTRKAADEKFREAANARKQSEELIRLLQNEDSVFEVLEKLGYDPKNLSEKYLMQQLEEDMLSPEEKEVRDMKRKLAMYEQEKKKQQEEYELRQRKELVDKYTENYSTQVIEALQTQGLPKTPHTVKRMAYYMHQALQRGYDLEANDIVHLVKEDYVEDQKALYSGLDGDKLTELLGKDVIEKIRKHNVSQVRKPSQSKPYVGRSSNKKDKSKGITMQEWRENLAKRYK